MTSHTLTDVQIYLLNGTTAILFTVSFLREHVFAPNLNGAILIRAPVAIMLCGDAGRHISSTLWSALVTGARHTHCTLVKAEAEQTGDRPVQDGLAGNHVFGRQGADGSSGRYVGTVAAEFEGVEYCLNSAAIS